MTKGKIIALIVVGIILLIVIVVIAKNIQTKVETTQGGTTNSVTKGLADIFDWATGLFKKDDPYVTTGCDPNKPGYNLDGLYDNNCQ